jgi:hypothetical protein
VLTEELEKLGYSTRDGMETVLVQGGELEITKPDLKEYAVSFSVGCRAEQFDTHLFRDSDTAELIGNERRLRDRSMEENWCRDLASLLSSAGERGVVTRITQREKPGAVPVAVRSRSDGRRSAGRSKARSLRLPGDE